MSDYRLRKESGAGRRGSEMVNDASATKIGVIVD